MGYPAQPSAEITLFRVFTLLYEHYASYESILKKIFG